MPAHQQIPFGRHEAQKRDPVRSMLGKRKNKLCLDCYINRLEGAVSGFGECTRAPDVTYRRLMPASGVASRRHRAAVALPCIAFATTCGSHVREHGFQAAASTA